jgi:hypothetical protein
VGRFKNNGMALKAGPDRLCLVSLKIDKIGVKFKLVNTLI